jgi:hypothetical protein
MEPKSKCQALVGYEDGSKSVLYYNAETQKILISRNFCFLEPSTASPEWLLIMPDDEGESRDAMDIVTGTPGESSGRPLNPLKHQVEEDAEGSAWQTRGRRVDYQHLNDLWQEDETMSAKEITNLLEGDDDQPTLEQAKWSLKWPKWEHAIQAELAQLRQKGTWKLVEKPAGAIPISNKWVLTKKCNKEGNVIKYKAWLVVCGFT